MSGLHEQHPDLRMIPVGLHKQHPDLGLIPVEQEDANPLLSLALSPASQHDLRIVPEREVADDATESEEPAVISADVTAEDVLEQFEEMQTEDGL